MFGVLVSAILLSAVTDVQSRYVQHPEIHRSVVHKKVIATWDEAKQRCEAEGAVMASPLDIEMLEYMRSSIGINNHTTPYFIGFKATANPELIFASVEGVPLDDLPEAAVNMIEQLDPQDGDCLGMGRHNIRVVSCRARLPYLCYKNETTTSTTAVPVDVTTESESEATSARNEYCSNNSVLTEGYTYLSGSYYKMHKNASWDDAQQICSAEGGYLAVINDAHEAQIVRDFVTNNNVDFIWIHIGVRDFDGNGNWKTVLGDRFNQLQIITTLFRCGAVDYEGELDTVACEWRLHYVCEKQC